MTTTKNGGKKSVTVKLDRATVAKVNVIAARRSTSVSELVACRIEFMFGEEQSYKRSERRARELFECGFRLGGGVTVGRDELHERKKSRG